MSNKVGFTTSIPIEVLLAAGKRPVDLNNVFINAEDAAAGVQAAESQGFPAACCAWVKGIFAVIPSQDLEEVVGVVRGDCSQTQALLEVLRMQGMPVYPFSYPYDRSPASMQHEIRKFLKHYGVREKEAAGVKRRLDRIRRKLKRLDRLTWAGNRVSGEENHRFLVSSSDMNGDADAFEKEIDDFLYEAGQRDPRDARKELRLGILGVPPIWKNLYGLIEKEGVRAVYNEVPRQFSMPALDPDLVNQYLRFTYPYDVFFRLEDIQRESRRRRLDGFIHYVQAFCFRQIEDKIVRHYLGLPILTLEGDRPECPDARTRVRLEAFIEMLWRNREARENRKSRN